MSRWIVSGIGVLALLACSGAVQVPTDVVPEDMENGEDAEGEDAEGEDAEGEEADGEDADGEDEGEDGEDGAEADARVDAIRTIYDRYQTDAIPTRKELPLSSGLKKAWIKGKDKVDFDPVINGQDFEISDIEVELDGNDVVVEFTNIGKEMEVRWVMIEEDGAWVAEDIRTEEWSLAKLVGK